MAPRDTNTANAAFRKPRRKLTPSEQRAQETARKSDRLKALRLARDAEIAAAAKPGEPVGEA